jgi:hypothetical protein
MDENESIFIKKLQNIIWQTFAGLILVIILAVVPFYFNTQNELRRNDEQIIDLKERKADRTAYELTVKQISDQLIEIKADIKEIKQGRQ